MPAQVRPFPWHSLDSTTRAEADAIRALRRWGAAHAKLHAIAEALGSLVGARVEVRLRRTGGLASEDPLSDGTALVIAPDAATASRHPTLVEVEGALGLALASRAMRRDVPRLTHAQPSANVAGALAAVVAATTRRVGGTGFRMLAAGPSAEIRQTFARDAGEAVVASFTVLVDDDAFLARIAVPRAAAATAPLPHWDIDALRTLGTVPLAVPIVATHDATSTADLASLGVGDAWVPARWPLVRTDRNTWAGPVLLASPSLETGTAAELCEDGRLVLRGEVEDLAWSEETAMTGPDTGKRALVDAIGEVPIVVRVEIGVAELRAREWAELGSGDVIALGRRIAEPVVLRVGSSEVARGELVEIDGQVGVRIVERFDGQGRTAS